MKLVKKRVDFALTLFVGFLFFYLIAVVVTQW